LVFLDAKEPLLILQYMQLKDKQKCRKRLGREGKSLHVPLNWIRTHWRETQGFLFSMLFFSLNEAK